MKTKEDKINIVTLGCAKNIVDSQMILTQLKGNNFDAYHENNDNDSNIIIINTCGFIENAKQESIDTILKFAQEKKRGNIKKLYVTGCLSERYKENLEKEIPEVDEYFGTNDLSKLLRNLKAKYRKDLISKRVLSKNKHYAYLKISEGCDRPCSFCAIPLMRGKHISKPIELLVEEAKNLSNKGVKELMIIAQDSTYYGIDLYKKRMLGKLLQNLSEIEAIKWIRLHYAFPTGFPMDILEVMKENKKICNYLDIPLQHGSSKILKIMRRGTSREKSEELIHRIREIIPNISIRTTLIAGHPGETERDFQEMYNFVEKMKFNRLGIFTYSHEEGTHSFSMKDDVPELIKKERADSIMKLQQKISYNLNQNFLDKKLKVIIDRKEENTFFGRTEFDSPEVDNEIIIKENTKDLKIGNFYNVIVKKALNYDLHCELI
tara:strand:- start:2105 stop:3406 length:1302 start_codon:yes stop_codon:yes gene_type:complete